MNIVCLHSAASNIPVFEEAAKQLGRLGQLGQLELGNGVLRHIVRDDLIAAAESAGGLTPEIEAATRRALVEAAREVDAVLLTCSTLGPAAEAAATETSVPILRADAALAQAITGAGGSIVVLCTVETTIEPTTKLFKQAIETASKNASLEVRLVPDAWGFFKAGNRDQYLASIAAAADRAYVEGASIVVLAQASMSDASALVSAGPLPLTVPTAGLLAATKAANRSIAPLNPS